MVHAIRVFMCAALLAGVTPPAHGQHPENSRNTNVRQAAFVPAPSGEAPRVVKFGRQAACIGDRVEQTLSLEMRLATSIRQGNQLVKKNQTTMRNEQRRVVTTIEVAEARTVAVDVCYLEATKHVVATDHAQPPEPSSPVAQPVQGKTYRCRRAGGQDGKLMVTDADGHIPPADEYEIVAQNMEMVGRANPLAEFLGGRSLTIGETIELPRHVAARLFHLGKRYGEVIRFDLTLEKTQAADGVPCAVFLARVEAASNDSSQMRLQAEGPLIVEIPTCRAVGMGFSGPIGMSETRGSYSTAHQLIGTGQLKMNIASAYRDAQR